MHAQMHAQPVTEERDTHMHTLTPTHTYTLRRHKHKVYQDRIINKNHKGSFITTFKIPSS